MVVKKPHIQMVDFSAQLNELGLHTGGWLAVFGDVAIGKDDASTAAEFERLFEALAAAVGAEGHLLVPAFTAGREFDPANTPAATGRFAEWFRRQPGVVRSLHPTHSVAVRGPRATELITDHDLYLPFRPETPLGRLVENDGAALLFGGDHRANALLQVGRLSVERERPVLWFNVEHVLEFGGRRRKRYVEQPCTRAYAALGPEMDARGIARPLDTPWGPAHWMRARAAADFAADVERETPERLLCSDEQCRWCRGMRYCLGKGS